MIKIKPGIIIVFIMLAVLTSCSKLEKDKTTKIYGKATIVNLSQSIQSGEVVCKTTLYYGDERLEIMVSDEFITKHKLGDSIDVTLMRHKLPSTDGHYYEFVSFNDEEAVS